jgi:molecular chaperone GrpE (heat shock protein)
VHQPFDPETMRAIDTVADASMPAGIVTEELRPGYRLHGAVLRAADVRVAR